MKPYGLAESPIGTGFLSDDTCRAVRGKTGYREHAPGKRFFREPRAMRKRARAAGKKECLGT